MAVWINPIFKQTKAAQTSEALSKRISEFYKTISELIDMFTQFEIEAHDDAAAVRENFSLFTSASIVTLLK
jgi:hypothetical protein